MPTLIVREGAISNREFAHEFASGFDIGDALRAGFTFNAAETCEPEFIERIEESLPLHFAGADGNFLAPLAGFFGAVCVLEMDLANSFTERPKRIDGIAAIVEDHIGGIEIDADVRTIELDEKEFEIVGIFLAGFESQFESLAFEHVGDLADAADEFLELRIFVVVREKASVEGDETHAERFRDIGDLLDVAPVLRPGGIRHDAAGLLDRFHGGVILTDGAEHAGDDDDAFFAEKVFGFAPDVRVFAERIKRELDGAEADLLQVFNQFLGCFGLERPATNSEAIIEM